jgi:hypothetical protein
MSLYRGMRFGVTPLSGLGYICAIAGGFLQIVVSKAREHTVLVRMPCLLALPIQH